MFNVVAGASLQCTFGLSPGTLVVIPEGLPVNDESRPAATVMDHIPLVNITTFGMCTSVANPVVASATAAALGVLTPMPCVPATATPWTPGSPTTRINNFPVLTLGSMCTCTYGGQISIVNPGATRTSTN